MVKRKPRLKDERVGLPMNSMPPADEFPLFVERLGNTPFKDLDQPEELATQNESTIEFPLISCRYGIPAQTSVPNQRHPARYGGGHRGS